MSDELFTQEEMFQILFPYAMKVIHDFNNYSRDVIHTFYADYHPKKYKRHFAMYHMWEINMEEVKDGIDVIIKYSSDLLGGVHNSDAEVFEGPFLEGYHGGPEAWGHIRNVPQMQPSPWDFIVDYYNAYTL